MARAIARTSTGPAQGPNLPGCRGATSNRGRPVETRDGSKLASARSPRRYPAAFPGELVISEAALSGWALGGMGGTRRRSIRRARGWGPDSVVPPFAPVRRKLEKHRAPQYASGNTIRFRKLSWSVFPSWMSRVRVPSTPHAACPELPHPGEIASHGPGTLLWVSFHPVPTSPTCSGPRRLVQPPPFATAPGMFAGARAARPSR
jgi:hypothetical protein